VSGYWANTRRLAEPRREVFRKYPHQPKGVEHDSRSGFPKKSNWVVNWEPFKDPTRVELFAPIEMFLEDSGNCMFSVHVWSPIISWWRIYRNADLQASVRYNKESTLGISCGMICISFRGVDAEPNGDSPDGWLNTTMASVSIIEPWETWMRVRDISLAGLPQIWETGSIQIWVRVSPKFEGGIVSDLRVTSFQICGRDCLKSEAGIVSNLSLILPQIWA
jgi:hypothetical protein